MRRRWGSGSWRWCLGRGCAVLCLKRLFDIFLPAAAQHHVGPVAGGDDVVAAIRGLNCLDPADAERINGFIINNFHGDPELFSEATHFLEKRTGTPCLGVVPHFAEAGKLKLDAPALDYVTLKPFLADGGVLVGVQRKGAVELLRVFPRSQMRIATAARLSATFPYVSPAARADAAWNRSNSAIASRR